MSDRFSLLDPSFSFYHPHYICCIRNVFHLFHLKNFIQIKHIMILYSYTYWRNTEFTERFCLSLSPSLSLSLSLCVCVLPLSLSRSLSLCVRACVCAHVCVCECVCV